MFAKLLKHEWKSTAGLLGILSAGALGVGLMAGVVLRLLVYYNNRTWVNDFLEMLIPSVLGTTLLFLLAAIFIYMAGTNIFLLIRFYRNKFTDQGYLTFTLPVTSHQIFLSSALNLIIWQVITTLVMGVSVGLAVVLGLDRSFSDYLALMDSIRYLIKEFGRVIFGGYFALTLVYYAVMWLAGTVISMTSITVGAVLAKRYKLLAAIGIYYAIQTAIKIVTNVLMVNTTLFASFSSAVIYLVLIVQILFFAGVLVGGYFLSTYLMKHKLNLP